jgi:anthranilate phosphoribosyltransferase
MALVDVSRTRFGSLVLEPVAKRLRRRVARKVRSLGAPAEDALVLHGDDAAIFLSEVAPTKAAGIERGSTERVRIDTSLLWRLYGFAWR